MKIELDLLENSLDFLKESFEDYIIADEKGVHQPYHSDYHKKTKWKMAFINLVQAIELIMKEIISEVSPWLIQSNIDSYSVDDKSITFTQCISRLIKFSNIKLSDEEISHLRSSAKLRNRYTHYDVSIASEEIKVKYSVLFSIYKRLYEEQLQKELYIENVDVTMIKSIIEFADKYTILRGIEIKKSDVSAYKEDISVAQQHPFFKDKYGAVVSRIRFGFEKEYHEGVEEGDHDSYYTPTIYLWDYCDDCGAKQGEYHLANCDLERCPICGEQALTCDCELKWAEDLENDS